MKMTWLCPCVLLFALACCPAEGTQRRMQYVPAPADCAVSQQEADTVYRTVADCYAEYTKTLQSLSSARARSAMASFQSVQARMRRLQPYFSMDLPSAASPAAKKYFAQVARSCVESEKHLSDATIAQIDETLAQHRSLARSREQVYRLFVEFFKNVVTDYSDMGVF